MPESVHFVVAGHLCLDLTPELPCNQLPRPGGLVDAGSLRISPGGAVANVGLALWRLGCQVRLVGLVGDDWLGDLLITALQQLGKQPGVRIAAAQNTSYSIVIAPRDCDRAFVHSAGANEVFTSTDLHDQDLEGANWLHFGYPPVMPAIAAHGGKELAALFSRAREQGLQTSLDFCSLGSGSLSTDWCAVLLDCARSVTLLAPSIEEIRTALRQPPRSADDVSDLGSLSQTMFAMGFAVVAIKLGTFGLYLATTDVAENLTRWQLGPEWCGREIWAPCFRADFVNACGAGDCAIAGLIASIASGSGPEQALTMGLATGASSVEAADASSGVRSIAKLQTRIDSGWERLPAEPPGDGWTFDRPAAVWNR